MVGVGEDGTHQFLVEAAFWLPIFALTITLLTILIDMLMARLRWQEAIEMTWNAFWEEVVRQAGGAGANDPSTLPYQDIMKQKAISLGFWVLWVVVNVIGWSLGTSIFYFMFIGLGYGETYSYAGQWWQYVYIAVAATIGGSIIGIGQWFVLRLRFPGVSGWWVLTCVVGPISLAWNVGLSFAAMGILQWLVLRRHVYGAQAWIIATIVIAVVCSPLTFATLDNLTDSNLIFPLLLIGNSVLMGLVLLGLSPQSSHT